MTEPLKPVLIFALNWRSASLVAKRLELSAGEWSHADRRERLMGCNTSGYRIVEVPGWDHSTAGRDVRAFWRDRELRFGASEVIPCPT